MESREDYLAQYEAWIRESLSDSCRKFDRLLLLSYGLMLFLSLANWQGEANGEFDIQGIKTPIDLAMLPVFICIALIFAQFIFIFQLNKITRLVRLTGLLQQSITHFDPHAQPFSLQEIQHHRGGIFGILMEFIRDNGRSRIYNVPFFSFSIVKRQWSENIFDIQREWNPFFRVFYFLWALSVGFFGIVKYSFKVGVWSISVLGFACFQAAVLFFPLFYSLLYSYDYYDGNENAIVAFFSLPAQGFSSLLLFSFIMYLWVATVYYELGLLYYCVADYLHILIKYLHRIKSTGEPFSMDTLSQELSRLAIDDFMI